MVHLSYHHVRPNVGKSDFNESRMDFIYHEYLVNYIRNGDNIITLAGNKGMADMTNKRNDYNHAIQTLIFLSIYVKQQLKA